MKYLLDTDTCIYLLKGLIKNAEAYFEALNPGILPFHQLLLRNYYSGPKRADISNRISRRSKALLYRLLSYPFDANAAKQYGYIRYKLEQSGRIIGSMDMLIAAIALANDVKLVTNNLKEFNRVSGLKTENWFKTK